MREKLPRWKKEDPILATQLNGLADAIERADSWQVDSSTGLQMVETSAGRTIGLALPRVATYAMVHDEITAASGLTLGKGTIDRYYKDDNGVLQPYDGDPEDCYNSTPSTVGTGLVIHAKWIDDGWAVDVVPCSTGS